MNATTLDDEIMTRFLGIAQKLRFLQRRQAREHGLTALQLSILQQLRQQNPSGWHAHRLTQRLDIGKATLSEAIRTLTAKKLITVGKDPSDARRQLLALSPKGEKVAHVSRLYLQPFATIIHPLPLPGKRTLLQNLDGILTRLNTKLGEEGTGTL